MVNCILSRLVSIFRNMAVVHNSKTNSLKEETMRNQITIALALLLTACGGGGSSDSTPPPAPTTKAPAFEIVGSTSINEQQPVQLSAQVSYPSSTGNLTIEWSQPNEQSIELNTDSLDASFTSPVVLLSEGQRVLTFSAKITDASTQKSTTDDIEIIVSAVNDAPQVNVENYSIAENKTATLTATAIDTDGEISSYAWQALDDSGVVITNNDSVNASFTAPNVTAPTPFKFSVTATDNEGASSTEQLVVTINPVVTGFVVVDTVVGATVSIKSIIGEPWLVLADNPTDYEGMYAIEVPFSLNNGYAVTASGGQVNNLDFDGTLTSICFAEDKVSCNVTPLTSLIDEMIKYKVEYGAQVNKTTKEDAINTLYNEFAIEEIEEDPFITSISTADFNVTNIRATITSEGFDTWLKGVIGYYTNSPTGYDISKITEFFPNIAAPQIVNSFVMTYNGEDIGAIASLNEKRTLSLVADYQHLFIEDFDVNTATVEHVWSFAEAENVTGISFSELQTKETTLVLGSVDEDTDIKITLATKVTTVDGNEYIDSITKTFTILNNLTTDNTPPEISHSAPQIVASNSQVVLTTTVNDFEDDLSDQDDKVTTYHWQQVFDQDENSPTVTIANDDTLTPSFTAPSVESTTTLTFLLTATDSGNDDGLGELVTSLSVDVFVQPAIIVKAQQLNDTGITLCGNYAFDGTLVHDNKVACDDQTHPDEIPAGQDALYGRDADPQLNDDADGYQGFSYTKLDAQGNPLAADAEQWSCTQDNVTGLIWEVKTSSSSTTDIHGAQHKANWYNSDHLTNGGSHLDILVNPEKFTGKEVYDLNCNSELELCMNSEQIISKVNTESQLCGFTDWRLPTGKELISLINYSKTNPMIDTRFFPNTVDNSAFLTSDTSPVPGFAEDGAGVYTLHTSFITGETVNIKKRYANMAFRLVRKGSAQQ